MERGFRAHGSHGPWIALLHGGPGAPGQMEALALELSREFRVVEPFERRAGETVLTVDRHVSDLARTFDQLPDARILALVGFSSGAITALSYATAFPHQVLGVVLVGAATFTEAARAEYRSRLEARLDDPARERLRHADALPTPEARLRERYAALLPSYFVDPVAFPSEAWIDATGHDQTWQDMLRLQTSGVHPRQFAAITCPVIMLHGQEDPHPGRLIYQSLREFMPHMEYVELPQCGHYPWLEKEARGLFLDRLTLWLRRVISRDQ